MLRVFNTLSRTKEEFQPVTPGKVGIYLCGPTVYKPSHIGHMVGPTIFDTIKRYLTYSGYETTWVVNITDVDDKLIAESNRRGIPMADVAAEMTEDYQKNLAAMGVDTVDHFPKATDYIGEIIKFTSDLIDKGYAYESEGDVYFDVTKFAEYGKLSNRTLDQMSGEVTITDGTITVVSDSLIFGGRVPTILPGQYIHIEGSVYNNGVYQYGEDALTNETFEGTVWLMGIPQAVIDLDAEITAWRQKYEAISSPAMSPFNSESFKGYSYSKGTVSSGAGAESALGWQNVFGPRLAPWRKI